MEYKDTLLYSSKFIVDSSDKVDVQVYDRLAGKFIECKNICINRSYDGAVFRQSSFAAYSQYCVGCASHDRK